VIFYHDRPTFVVSFKPHQSAGKYYYTGKLFIDRETYALVRTEYGLDKSGLKIAHQSMIKKKPKDFFVRPTEVTYSISYKYDNNKWYFYTAQANIICKVKSKNDRVNSVFQSTSDLLVTDYEESNLRRFKTSETFHPNEVFTEMIVDFDEDFWGNFNTIKPHENLKNAIKVIDNAEAL